MITIADTTPFVLNRIFNIKAENRTDNTQITAGAVPVITVNGYPGLRQQWGIVHRSNQRYSTENKSRAV